MIFDDFVRKSQPIRTGNFFAGHIPHDQMHVVGVELVKVDLVAGSFADRTEGDLAQAPDFTDTGGESPGQWQ